MTDEDRAIELAKDIHFIINNESGSEVLFALSLCFYRAINILSPDHLNKDFVWTLMLGAKKANDFLEEACKEEIKND
jgi:hypothetical protein